MSTPLEIWCQEFVAKGAVWVSVWELGKRACKQVQAVMSGEYGFYDCILNYFLRYYKVPLWEERWGVLFKPLNK